MRAITVVSHRSMFSIAATSDWPSLIQVSWTASSASLTEPSIR
jgi:hypothetical protein